jgi:serine/threonine-protein kinase
VSDLSGEVIDNRYELLSLIAAGGMASIYKANDRRLDRFVAVKIMHPHLANDEEFVNRFIREAKAIAALSHPNIVSIQDQGWNEGGAPAVFIVMEYIDGFTLRDLLIEKGHLSARELLHYVIPVVSALAQAHSLGINHRDLKPENILISKDGRVKIADFGLARGGLLGSTMTVDSSVVLGSVSYLSPEQVERGISDARSDIYSFGVMCFELLTGQKPFDGDTPIQIAFKHVNERIPAPSTLRSDVPPALDAVIYRATSPNPDQRQRNGAELFEELQVVQVGLDPKRSQLSLDLDLPLETTLPKRKTTRPEVRVGNTLVTRIKSLTEPTSVRSRESKPNFVPEGKLEAPSMSNSGAVRRKTSKRVQRNRYIASIIVLLVVAGGLYQLAWPVNGVSIPSVAGMSLADATSTLSNIGMKAVVSLKEYDSEVPAGEVISSSPGGGAHLKKGSTVGLVISEGIQVVPPPTPTPTPTPTPSTSVTTAPVAINSYIGLTSDQAQNELTAAGMVVNQTFDYSDTVPAGSVISQTPDGTTPVLPGTTINLVVSQGSSSVYIPNVYSLTRTAATTELENLQLKVVVHTIGNGKHVTNVSPKVGSKVKRGSTVYITLG